MPLIPITGPAALAVSVVEVLDSFRSDAETALTAQATLMIKALTRHAEARTGRALITQTFELVLDDFPSNEVDLILPSVQSIESVKYVDVSGNMQTLVSTSYVLDGDSTPGWLFPAANMSWPETYAQANAVRIRFKAGYGDAAADVPEDIRLWIIAHVTQVLENPSGVIDQAFRPLPFLDAFLHQYIVYRAM